VIDHGVDQLRRVIDQTGCRVILDHHALRSESYADRFRSLWDTGHVVTAAGFLGLEDAALESKRRSLWAHKRKPAASMPARLNGRRRSDMIEARRDTRREKGGAAE
jgi:predicted metallo-beta-lactamase superfamily hydrolase